MIIQFLVALAMVRHYFKLAIKALIRYKFYSFINIFGLVSGMLSALIIAKYIGGSLDFDSFHENKDRIYTITQEESLNGNLQTAGPATYWGIGELASQYPEVISTTRYNYHVSSLVMIEGTGDNNKSYIESKIRSADSSFFKTFTFPMIYGDPESALSQTNSIVLTRSTSKKYFGNSNPIGKALTFRASWGAERTYEITGVMEDIPARSQFRFDLLTSLAPPEESQLWNFIGPTTFVMLKDGSDADDLAKKLTEQVNGLAPLNQTNRRLILSLSSLAKPVLPDTQYLLAVVGIFIILISWINFINQMIVQSYNRVQQTGILRIMGATRINLVIQFIVESSLICFISLVLIITGYVYLEPYMQTFSNNHLLPLVGDPSLINIIFLSIFLLGIVLSATIPSVILFSRDFRTNLASKLTKKTGGLQLRMVLVILQFSISTILIIGIFVIRGQLDFMSEMDKGINMGNILIVKSPIEKDSWENKTERVKLFKEKCAELPFISGITSSSTIPGEEYRHEIYLSMQGHDEKTMVYVNGMDDQFLNLYEVQFITGNGFVHNARWQNMNSIIINESAAKALGITDLDASINTRLLDHESNEAYNLIGIVKDYHKTSLKYEIQPMAFKFNISWGLFSLKISKAGLDKNGLKERMSEIEQVWHKVYQDAPFDYFFLGEKFASQDREDQNFASLFEFFTILSILISCLGLFGLSLLLSTIRHREIGVRKVFGASSFNILTIFLKGYLLPLCIAVIIGCPIAWFLMDTWLHNFSYRIEIGFGLVSMAVLSLAIIFFLTVSYHTIRSSIADPVNILRE